MRSSFMDSAARRTAPKMRTWLPQRQTRLSKAVRISASRGMRILVEQRLCGQHPAVQAIAALEGLLLDEGRLHRMRILAGVPRPSSVTISLPARARDGQQCRSASRDYPPARCRRRIGPGRSRSADCSWPRLSRSTYSRGQSGSASTSCIWPFIFSASRLIGTSRGFHPAPSEQIIENLRGSGSKAILYYAERGRPYNGPGRAFLGRACWQHCRQHAAAWRRAWTGCRSLRSTAASCGSSASCSSSNWAT